MKAASIIVAAGNGTRMGSKVRKPYLMIGNKPIIIRALEPFLLHPSIHEHILVVHPEEIIRTDSLLRQFGLNHRVTIVSGGKERQDSVEQGLRSLSTNPDYVLIHDGARPFVSERLIQRILAELESKEAIIPAVPVKDTIKVVGKDNHVESTPDRQSLWAVQTPQAFHLPQIAKAYEIARMKGITGTDDASLLEKTGFPVYIVEGEYTNIKITTPEDIPFGEVILRMLEEKYENRSRI